MSILTTLGAGSGVDTTQLVADLVAQQRANADSTLKARQTANDAKISALSQINSAIGGFSTALNALVTSGQLGLQTMSGDSTVIAASRSGSSEPLAISSQIEVRQLANRQTIASAPVADKNAAIGQGTLTINFGALTGSLPTPTGFTASGQPPVTITIGPENDSLVGLAQAINGAGAGLSASIVQDTGGARLVIKGDTGAEQAFTISGSAGLEAFAFGPGTSGMSWTGQAGDALLVVDGLNVRRPTNSITDLMDGIKLDLLKTNIGSTVTVGSAFEADTLKLAVSNYVDAYNQLVNMLAKATQPAADGTAAGPLTSDSTVRELKRTLAGFSTKTLLSGTGPKSLAEIGLKTNRDGTLAIDDAKLSVMVSQFPQRVHDMFVPGQSSSSPLLAVASALGAAKTGSYAVANVMAATAGTATGGSAPNAFDTPVVIDGSNKSFSVTVDGRTSLTINLAEGSYASGSSLAAAFQAAINADPVLQSFGLGASASWNGSAFTFRSNSMGSASAISLSGLDPTLAGTLGLGAPLQVTGTDASGTIAGVAASATGNQLNAAASSAAAGLSLTVFGGVASATIDVRETIAGMLADLQGKLTATGGGFTTMQDRLSKEAKAIADEQARVDASSASLKDRLTKQFAAMEKAVAAFKSTQKFMQQQIDIWTNKDS